MKNTYMTVIRNDKQRYEVHMVVAGTTQPRFPDRDYGRLDSAVAAAFTKAKHSNIPLRLEIEPN